jgi:hypothetical protein
MQKLKVEREFSTSFKKLHNSLKENNYKGYDPYDGLNSKLFQVTPLKYSAYARLAWIQLFKRNPVNLRKLFLVPKEYNPKALGLFLTGYSNLYKIAQTGNSTFVTEDEILDTINFLADQLINLQSEGYSGACWGYNFDWQARGGLYFPKGTPNVVATTFAVYGLLDAAQVLEDEKIKGTAVTAADFVINDLSRTQKEEGFLFSYAPKFGNNTVYNASLLASKLLARIYSFTKEEDYLKTSHQSVLACCNAQNDNGSWRYGELPIQDWIDSFHTGFNLEALYDYQKYTQDDSFQDNFEIGLKYYIENFFLEDGTPKYYNDSVYPIDIHSPAQFVITMAKCNRLANHYDLIKKVMSWTCKNMQDEKGYFYYQVKKLYTNKISYMRWSQAWMFCALSYYLRKGYGNH